MSFFPKTLILSKQSWVYLEILNNGYYVFNYDAQCMLSDGEDACRH